ncbi:hypothetical protein [Dehalobacter sp. TBBPA1]|uniref:YfjL-like protein n=1 Tax=Dehalobacter sp. TBBPA1 TaxID=3235037 RepID=UPI0034A4AF7E
MSILRRFLIIIISLIILLTGYTFFYGPPFGNTIAKNKVQKYQSVIYEDFRISDVSYNCITNNYYAEVYDKNGRKVNGIRYNIYDNVLSDENLNWSMFNKLNMDLSKIAEGFSEDIKIPSGSITTDIYAKGNFLTSIKNLHFRQSLHITGIVNSDVYIKYEDSIKKPAEITKKIIDELGENYRIISVHIIYIDINGVYEIVVNNSGLSYESLEKNTKIMKTISEEEKKIIENLKEDKLNNSK